MTETDRDSSERSPENGHQDHRRPTQRRCRSMSDHLRRPALVHLPESLSLDAKIRCPDQRSEERDIQPCSAAGQEISPPPLLGYLRTEDRNENKHCPHRFARIFEGLSFTCRGHNPIVRTNTPHDLRAA